MTIALATSAALPQLDPDDQLLLKALHEMSLAAEPVIWSNPDIDWSQYALCVIRSTWDYYERRPKYLNWVAHASTQTSFWNPAPLIAWNTDKTYLRDLEAKGVSIVKTEWRQAGQTIDFEALLSQPAWAEVVIKPVISASGKNTFRVNQTNLAALKPDLQRLANERDLMVQPFMHSITETGEWSFLFIDGQFSHAVAKVPAQGEFRVQEHLGGQLKRFTPDARQLAFAENVIQQIDTPALYGRVDVMLDETGQMRLGELELTEPSMYLSFDSESPRRFAEAIRRKLS
jgi:hypothetical protein